MFRHLGAISLRCQAAIIHPGPRRRRQNTRRPHPIRGLRKLFSWNNKIISMTKRTGREKKKRNQDKLPTPRRCCQTQRSGTSPRTGTLAWPSPPSSSTAGQASSPTGRGSDRRMVPPHPPHPHHPPHPPPPLMLLTTFCSNKFLPPSSIFTYLPVMVSSQKALLHCLRCPANICCCQALNICY